MKFQSEADLKKHEPKFLWKSPIFYRVEKKQGGVAFDLSLLPLKAIVGYVILFSLLVAFGIVELLYHWPLYAAIAPILICGFVLTCLEIFRRKKFAGCHLELSQNKCIIITPGKTLEIHPLVEVCVSNRHVKRDGSGIYDGDSELFLVTIDKLGERLFFPLAKAGISGGMSYFAKDIARCANCKYRTEKISKL